MTPICYQPKYAFLNINKDSNGEVIDSKMKFIEFSQYLKNKEKSNYYTLPCGKCLECLKQYSNEWAFRIMCEASEYSNNCFITLTYADNPVYLNKKDLQLFLKRFRKKYKNIRYFACGEYGSRKSRPHFHLIVFNYFPEDSECFNKKKGLFGSKSLESIWGKGFVSCGKLTLEDAKYCAKYLQKAQFVSSDFPPFTTMSLKPGIGLDYYKKNELKILKTDKLYFNGKSISTPRYFLRYSKNNLTNEKFELLNEIVKNRKLKADISFNLDNNKFREEKAKKILEKKYF